MKELAINLWAFFLAAMFFGVWTLPLLAVMVAVAVFVRLKYPGRFDKYL
jgi:hypothetical protein